jgi:hypothetical protein
MEMAAICIDFNVGQFKKCRIMVKMVKSLHWLFWLGLHEG